LWIWNEVWLVAFGGTLFVAFPAILAVSFAGFYLALFLLLWALVLRGISIEASGFINDPLWRTGWHACFVGSNVLLAVLIGTALGNVVRGFPLDANGRFTLSFFTNFSPRGNVGILDWYTISVAIFTLVTLAAHGANGLAMKTEGPVYDRSLRIARLLWKTVIPLLIIITIESWGVRPQLFYGMLHQPFGWLGLICVSGGLVAVFAGLQSQRERCAVLGSCVFISGLMISGAAGAFPTIIYSLNDSERSLSAYQSAAAGHGLVVALVWWPVALILSIIYFLFIYRYYAGKVKPLADPQSPY
jgi:cytochrome bd ubiquinol oxidase subunit II